MEYNDEQALKDEKEWNYKRQCLVCEKPSLPNGELCNDHQAILDEMN